jgi:diguanylate cyclase (GGDEF)-like protein
LLATGGGLLLAGLLSVLIASSVTGPIVRIGRAVERLSRGDLRARVDARRTGVLRALAEGVNEMADSLALSQDELQRRVQEATEALRQQKEAAERLARIDPLTGLLNRRAFLDASEVEIRRVLRHRQPLSVIAIDLDHFKSINDSYGHGAGDAVLVDFAHVVSQQLRGLDLVARLGGEEFVVLLPDSDALGALRVAERLRLAIADSGPQVGEGVLHYTASFGVAGLDPGQSSLEELLGRADEALYAAKRQGRNRVELAPAAHAGPAS